MTTININLLPEEMRPGKGSSVSGGGFSLDQAALVPIGIGAGLAVVLFMIPSALVSLYFDPKDAELDQTIAEVQEEIDKYNTSLKDLQGQSDRRDQLRKQLNTLQSVAGVTASWGAILNELRTLTPGNMWFEEFRVDSAKSELLLKGGALDYGAVAYFQRNLEHSEYFSGPTLRRTENLPAEGRAGYIAFEMTVALRSLTSVTR
ncbi:MAG: PilN domain-containing protein [Candidatus Sericytochromatia bacterium]|nr:PilN domain-containing protein [Candidatus Sericytochromatia bacterium]